MEEDMYEGMYEERMYEEGYGDDNVLNKLAPEDREEKLKTQPVYSEEEDKGDDLFRQFFITRFERKPEHDPSYFQTWVERLSKPNPEGYMDSKSKEVWDMIKRQDSDRFIDSVMNDPHGY
jgi:hypothetical protein